MKNILSILGLLLLVGCSAPESYQLAAEKYAEELCEGQVTELQHRKSLSVEVSNMYFNFTCTTVTGSVPVKVKYYAIPVQFFKEK